MDDKIIGPWQLCEFKHKKGHDQYSSLLGKMFKVMPFEGQRYDAKSPLNGLGQTTVCWYEKSKQMRNILNIKTLKYKEDLDTKVTTIAQFFSEQLN